MRRPAADPVFMIGVRHGLRPINSAFRIPNDEFIFPRQAAQKCVSAFVQMVQYLKCVEKLPFSEKKGRNLPSESASEMSLFPFPFLCILPIDKKPRKPL